MSIRAMSLVWERSELGGTELLLLLAIADHANDDGKAWPSVKTLAHKIRMSERNTRYLLRKIASCEIQIEPNKGPKGCNVFRLQSLQRANISEGQPVAEGGATHGREGGQPIAPESSGNHQRTVIQSSPKMPAKMREIAYSPEFEALWVAYPRREGGNSKPDCWKQFQARLRQGVSAKEMIEGVRRYSVFVRSTEQEGTRFVKQAATFLGTGLHFRESWELEDDRKYRDQFAGVHI